MRFVILGASDIGVSLAANLTAHRHDVVLIEKDPERIGKVVSALELQVVIGNGTSPEVLARAGLEDSDYFIAVTESDEANIAACFVSRLLNPKPKRIARLRDITLLDQNIAPELVNEYFDLIINPDMAAADYLLQLLRLPGAREIVEFEGGRVQVIGLSVESHSPLLNVKLGSLKASQAELPLLIVAIMRGSKLIVPRGDDKIRPGDIIYAVTTPERTKLLFELVGKPLHEAQSVMIWGGRGLGRSLAKQLEALGANVKLVVSDEEVATAVAREFKSVLVLRGDGTDQNLLLEEKVGAMDAFLGTTDDDENNILASLLAKKLGVKTTMAVVNNSSYLPLVSAIGVDVVMSARVAAASAIFRHIHSRSIIYESALQQEGAGFIEVTASEGLPLMDKPLHNLDLPYGILVTAIIRGDRAIIPGGDDIIKAGDRVVIFVVRSALRKLERILELKLELFG